MKNERQFLDWYCSDSDNRPAIQMPFRQNGRICATDGHMLIRIDERLLEGEYYDTPNGCTPPDTDHVVPVADRCEQVTRRMLEACLKATPEEKERQCPECLGGGTVEWKYQDRLYNSHTMKGECPECGGSGELSDYTAVKYHYTFHGSALSYHHLRMLLRTMDFFGTDTLRLRHAHELEAMLFDVEGKDVQIVTMPQVRDPHLQEVRVF